MQHQFKVDPNKVRALPAGVAYLISRGRAMRVSVLRAPDVRTPLPAAEKLVGGDLAVPLDSSVSEKPVRLPF
jgi:hypothetical protein